MKKIVKIILKVIVNKEVRKKDIQIDNSYTAITISLPSDLPLMIDECSIKDTREKRAGIVFQM